MSVEAPAQLRDDAVLRSGQIVAGKYRVAAFLAEGGMAAVWAGTNLRTGKRVALKVILRSFASNASAAELFRREALAASKVNHPNVVNIFDVVDHQGMTCIVMELLEGETFAAYLSRKERLSLQEAGALLLPAMRGVAAANAQGVVHRDLKPGNIFLCKGPDGRLLNIKVLDFGVSSMAERALAPLAQESEEFVRFGTPAYMAPEDIACSPTVDARSDVYGFGVLLFEALTGRLPFPGEPGPDLLRQIMTVAPPRVTDLRPDLPTAVAAIIDCALTKDPSDRFPDVDHLIRAAEDHLMPRLQVTRSLSPIVGVALLPVDSDKNTAFPLATTSAHKSSAGTAGLFHRKIVRVLADVRRVLDWRIGLGTLLAAVLIAALWTAGRTASAARTASDPETPQSPRTSIAESAAFAAQVVGPPLDSGRFTPPSRSAVSGVGDETDKVGATKLRAVPATALPPSQRTSADVRPMLHGPTRYRKPPTSELAPRAGRLTAADF